jgi:hypothetical protein
MIFQVKKNEDVFLLRIWHSNYYLNHYEDPIWLGSVILLKKKNQLGQPEQNQVASQQWPTLFEPMYPAIKNYRVRSLVVKDSRLKSLRYVIPPELLIIKNSSRG